MDSPTVLIIGGGVSGLFCGLQAAGDDRNVQVLEKKPSCGRKLMITGSGQCNLTHDGDISEFFSHYGDHGAFLRPALRGYTNRHLVGFFEEQGLALVTDPGGKIFPATRKAADILNVLLDTCRHRGVNILCNQAVTRVSRESDRFLVDTPHGSYPADVVVIATGGASYPATGSTGDGYRIAGELGHTVAVIAPALTPVIIRDHPFAGLPGISFENLAVSLYRGNRKIGQHAGDLLFTHTGLSGPGVLDFSRYIQPGDILKVTFIAGMGEDEARRGVTGALGASGNRRVKSVLTGLPLPERFVLRLLDLSGIPSDLTCSQLPKQARQKITSFIAGFPFVVLELGGFGEAMVTRGGVTISEIDPGTMESRLIPNLFIIGEVLDIDGDTGGYNLQAAFSTAMLAARSIARQSGNDR